MHLLQGRGGELARALMDTDDRMRHGPRVEIAVADTAPRSCPTCDLAMSALHIGNVRIDSCPTHGGWFDHLEATRVVRQLILLARRQRGTGPSLFELASDLRDWLNNR